MCVIKTLFFPLFGMLVICFCTPSMCATATTSYYEKFRQRLYFSSLTCSFITRPSTNTSSCSDRLSSLCILHTAQRYLVTLTRWNVSSIPANGIFLTKKLKLKLKMPNGWRTIKSLVHKIRLHSRRGKGMTESFSREKLRHAPQKEGG